MTTRRSVRRRGALVLGAAAAAAALAYSAGAEHARLSAPAPTAVATVDPDRVLSKLNELKDRDAALKARGEKLQEQVAAVGKELETVQADLKLEKPGTARWRELRAKEIELEALGKTRVQSLQQILDLERGSVMKELYDKIVAATEALAKRDGWELVLLDDRAMVNLPDEGTYRDMGTAIRQKKVFYAAERVDLSDQVATFMNNEFVPKN